MHSVVVCAPVRDNEIDVRKDGRLREELRSGHVLREVELLVLGTDADEVAVRCLGEHLEEALHQRDICGSERAEAEIDERPAVAVGWRPWLVGRAHARLQVVPCKPGSRLRR